MIRRINQEDKQTRIYWHYTHYDEVQTLKRCAESKRFLPQGNAAVWVNNDQVQCIFFQGA